MNTTPQGTLRCAVLNDYQDIALRYADWNTLAPRVEMTNFRQPFADEAQLVEQLKPYDIVCLMRERTALPASVLDALPNLKLIVTAAMWNAVIDVEHATRKGIVVSGTQSLQSGTPELIWLLVLALARNHEQERENMRSGGWQTTVGMDLRKRTIGLLGLGNIGQRVAKVANAFGMRVIAWSQNLTAEKAEAAGATLVDKATLLAEADFVSIQLKLSARTHHIVGAAELAAMKPTAYLINTSRGPLVDEGALVDALKRGHIAGAGLDVYDVEPLPADHPFRSLPNVVALPHIGYVTEAQYRLFFPQFVENIAAWLAGAPVRVVQSSMPPA
ncbi:D-2-hydroxyacid dehydrogenase family protein [Ramlibacter sp.]|uniref:D-2-hydroxyacid dehydrogenase family protein n=1 Tax=Ramlibacter sp. TaxID=1917967 RepID=UPI003D0E3F53